MSPPAATSVPLSVFAENTKIAVAMSADMNRVGAEGDMDSYERWHDGLHQAVDDGLESAERRANGLGEGR